MHSTCHQKLEVFSPQYTVNAWGGCQSTVLFKTPFEGKSLISEQVLVTQLTKANPADLN